MIWIVVQEAVYRHAILGAFDSQEAAEARAKEASLTFSSGWRDENVGKDDGHHDYIVYFLPLDESIDDAKPVASFNRGQRR